MPDKFKCVTDDFWVAPQVHAKDIATAAAQGFSLIINNRPDGEMPGQPKSADIEAASKSAGLAYAFIPVGPEGITQAHLTAFDEARAATHDGKTLAFCRSGQRSAIVRAYAAAQSGKPAKDIIFETANAGFDISAHAPVLEHLNALHQTHNNG